MSSEPRQSEMKYLAMISDSEALKYFKSINNQKFIKTHKRADSIYMIEPVPIPVIGLKRKRED